jgi:hypothetical protein
VTSVRVRVRYAVNVSARFPCVYVTMVTLLAVTACYGLPPPPHDQPPRPPKPGWIQGVVKDGNGGPDQDVLVEARTAESHALSASARTDALGYYKLELAPGDYTVVFSFPSSLQLTQAAHVTSDRVQAHYEREPTPGHVPNCLDPKGPFSVRMCFP